MKELSIEEKPIDVVRQMVSDGQISQEVAEKYFPALKESEDERIRKALIRFHKSTINIDGIKGEDIIAWLEKQGEQNLTNSAKTCKDEWKPSWSEEDEYLLDETIKHLEALIRIIKKQGSAYSDEIQYYQRDIDWLKSLKNRVGYEVNCTTTKEWNEVDKAIIDYLLQLINNSHKEPCTKGLIAFGAEAWLKSLIPQSQWKPSDEQIEALLKLEEMHVLEHEKNQENAHLYMVVKSLREQLLKLREE